jgi:hypothetical protein
MATTSITLKTLAGDKMTLKRWPTSRYCSTAGIAIGWRTDSSKTGYWWQPLVLSCRSAAERAELEPIARRLYEQGQALGIVRGETFRDVAE